MANRAAPWYMDRLACAFCRWPFLSQAVLVDLQKSCQARPNSTLTTSGSRPILTNGQPNCLARNLCKILVKPPPRPLFP